MRVGISDDVQPVLRPTLAVTGGREQALDDPLVRIGTTILDESGDLFGGGRQPDQVEGDASEPGGAAGLRGRLQSFLIQPAEDHSVDWIPGPGVGGDRGDGRSLDRLERPVIASVFDLGEIDPVGPRGAFVDPSLQNGDLGGGERVAGRGHARGFVLLDELEEWAVFDVARDDGGPVTVAPLEGLGLDVQAEAAFVFLSAVAGVAMLLEDRSHIADEVDGFRLREVCGDD